jgi:hypothetical protein
MRQTREWCLAITDVCVGVLVGLQGRRRRCRVRAMWRIRWRSGMIRANARLHGTVESEVECGWNCKGEKHEISEVKDSGKDCLVGEIDVLPKLMERGLGHGNRN